MVYLAVPQGVYEGKVDVEGKNQRFQWILKGGYALEEIDKLKEGMKGSVASGTAVYVAVSEVKNLPVEELGNWVIHQLGKEIEMVLNSPVPAEKIIDNIGTAFPQSAPVVEKKGFFGFLRKG